VEQSADVAQIPHTAPLMTTRQQFWPVAQLVGQLPICGPPSSTGPSPLAPLSSPLPLLLPLLLPELLPLLLLPELLVLPLLPLLPPSGVLEELDPQPAPAAAMATTLPNDTRMSTFIDFMESLPQKTRRTLASPDRSKVSHGRHAGRYSCRFLRLSFQVCLLGPRPLSGLSFGAPAPKGVAVR
jgi:hypothetical protein